MELGRQQKPGPLGSASSNPAHIPPASAHIHFELWEGLGWEWQDEGGIPETACSPAAPQFCCHPEMRANHSHLKMRPRGPGPRWCHRVLGCHLNLEAPGVKIVQHLFYSLRA